MNFKSMYLFIALFFLIKASVAFSAIKIFSFPSKLRCAISKLALFSRTDIADLGKVLRGVPVEKIYENLDFDPGSIVNIYQVGSRITVMRRNNSGISTEATYILSDNNLSLVRAHYPAEKLSASNLKGKTILDAGCGGGSTVKALREELGVLEHDNSVRGFDIYFPEKFNRPSYVVAPEKPFKRAWGAAV